MKTAELLRKNHDLQREIEDLQRQTKNFVLSVLSNPENRHILENIRSGAQLYEVRDRKQFDQVVGKSLFWAYSLCIVYDCEAEAILGIVFICFMVQIIAYASEIKI